MSNLELARDSKYKENLNADCRISSQLHITYILTFLAPICFYFCDEYHLHQKFLVNRTKNVGKSGNILVNLSISTSVLKMLNPFNTEYNYSGLFY